MSAWGKSQLLIMQQEYTESFREMQKEAKRLESASPKQYGEYLQKKRKRGKRK